MRVLIALVPAGLVFGFVALLIDLAQTAASMPLTP